MVLFNKSSTRLQATKMSNYRNDYTPAHLPKFEMTHINWWYYSWSRNACEYKEVKIYFSKI